MARKGPPPAERVRLDPRSPWWGEHRSRYHFAAKFVRGKSVLDIACGTGFGSRILHDAGATFVVGADVSIEALEPSVSTLDDVSFCIADGTKLPFIDDSFDVVTSFETIEHVEDDAGFIAELARVLRTPGRLVLSTPNARHSRPVAGRPANPFHVREYLPDELEARLRGSFRATTLLGQRARDAYRINPYWQRRDSLPQDLRGRAQFLSWRLQNKLPFGFKDRVSRLLHNRAFYPGEFDFVFVADAVDSGHVLVVVCEP